ncbi:hypothetical protein [Streptomyces flavofungini]|uniref:hypothetical protein n=1 Tax=Streptomyces flavofungini TaxID=68200 RepID=UPI0025B2319E|nr:hypothetical protein [Streptomyces flavofungini]WJV48629.1 hypothetical protein QUY26_25815 [Streptomyces flavofungini]
MNWWFEARRVWPVLVPCLAAPAVLVAGLHGVVVEFPSPLTGGSNDFLVVLLAPLLEEALQGIPPRKPSEEALVRKSSAGSPRQQRRSVMPIQLEACTFAYGRRKPPVLGRLTHTVPDGFTVLLGPTGAGQPTLLKLAAGVTRPSAGRVRLGGRGSHTRDTGSGSPGCRRPSLP